jgi:hypothetical protein
MTTTLPEAQDRETRLATPSAWSAPRADGPLAQALRRAQELRSQGGLFDNAADVEAPSGGDLPKPAVPDPAPDPESFQHDIELLAQEALARDGTREALAIALEWPEDAAGRRRQLRPWMGWAALAGALVLGGAAAAIAVAFSPPEEPALAPPDGEGLKIEKRLSLPRDAARLP